MSDWRPGQPLKIETERFIVRSLTADDVNEDYVSWWNDPEIQQGFGNPPRGFTIESARQHVVKFNNKNNFHLGIFLKSTGKLIGFYAITVDHRQKISKANLCIGDKSLWSKGTATEIAIAAMKIRFEEMGVEKIEGEIRGDNRASMALYDKLGFKKEGTLRKQGIGPGGKRIDIHLYGLLKREWQERYGL